MATTKVAQRTSSASATRTEKHEETTYRHIATIDLPFFTAEFRAPVIHFPALPVHAPSRHDLTEAVSAVRSRLPAPEEALYFAGLGLLGLLELIEWPVALAIATGTVIAQRHGAAGGADGARHPGSAPDKPSRTKEPAGR
jgi:hypothetical protein